jgi:hypothetical protein
VVVTARSFSGCETNEYFRTAGRLSRASGG